MTHYGTTHHLTHRHEAFLAWLDEGCPQLARVEVEYRQQTVTAEELLVSMLSCGDVMPDIEYNTVVAELELDPRAHTYVAVARALLLDPRRKSSFGWQPVVHTPPA
jgi:hypothetical protein